MPAWATLIALTVDGDATVGVVSAPALGRRWWGAARAGRVDVGRAGRAAAADRGLRGRRLGDAYLSTTDLREFREQGAQDRWLALVDAVWETRAFGDFWQHVLVAEGVLDVAVDPVANAWDLAALAPSSREAGDRLTDLTGSRDVGGRRRAHHQRRAARRGPRRDRPAARTGRFRRARPPPGRLRPARADGSCRESLSASREVAGAWVGPPGPGGVRGQTRPPGPGRFPPAGASGQRPARADGLVS